MKKTVMKKYAQLIAVTGANVQKGQEVMIHASVEVAEFVRMVAEECYRAGAKKVIVEWSYQPLEKIDYRYRSLKTLSAIEKWELERLEHRVEALPAMIYLESDDPDGLAGVNQQKMAKARQARYPFIKPYRDKMENRYQWVIAAVPGEKWAKKMFPELSRNRAVEKLWEAILYTARADGEDPIADWKTHNADLAERSKYLNDLGIEELIYIRRTGPTSVWGSFLMLIFSVAERLLLREFIIIRICRRRRYLPLRCAARRREPSLRHARSPIRDSSLKISRYALKTARQSRYTPKRTKNCFVI